MKPFRCQICSETYLGDFAPDRCPFCGSVGSYLLSLPEYIEYGAVELSAPTREFCRQALELEAGDIAFYHRAEARADHPVIAALFQAVGRQRQRHLETVAKLAGIASPSPLEDEEDSEGGGDLQTQAHDRASRASRLYLEIAQQAPEGRAKEVFRALADSALEHYKIFNLYR